MAQYEKHVPYYYDGTTWKKIKVYINQNGTDYSLQQSYVAVNIPILNAFILPATTLKLDFEKR